MSNGQLTPAYQNLFGSTAYHTVDSSRSVLSPAAYFVDLMRLKNENIPDAGSTNALESRRPDLLQIPLDGQNTNTLISKLEIVNEVLKRSLPDADLRQAHYPFNLPFNQPLADIREYLSTNETSLLAIRKELGNSRGHAMPKDIALEMLSISPEQWALYSKVDTSVEDLKSYYGLSSDADLLAELGSVEKFLNKTGLSRNQLHELLFEDLSAPEKDNKLNAKFFINVGIGGEPLDLAVNQDSFNYLTVKGLDNIHRFVRLSQSLGWTFTDLDWALRTIGAIVNTTDNNNPVINDDALPYLAWIQAQHQEHKFSINQCCALIGTLKDFGLKKGQSFFDQVFKSANVPNPPAWVDSSGQYTLTWTVPQPGASDAQKPEDRQIQNALAAALQISQDDLLTIAKVLKPQTNNLTLTQDTLAILYRFSQLPKLTGISLQASLLAAELKGIKIGDLAASPAPAVKAALVALVDFAKWLKGSPFSVYQLQFILKGESGDLTLQNKILGTNAVVNFLQSLYTSIEKTSLTEAAFFHEINDALKQKFRNLSNDQDTREQQSEINKAIANTLTRLHEISKCIYKELQSSHITPSSIVLSLTIDNSLLDKAIDKAIDEILVTSEADTIKKLIEGNTADDSNQIVQSVTSTLSQYYNLQQNTLADHLAALYRVSSQMGAILKEWGHLKITMSVPPNNPDTDTPKSLLTFLSNRSSKPAQPAPSDSDIQTVMPILRNLQQVALLVTDLALSPSEAAYFVNAYQPEKPSHLLSLEAAQEMSQFKQLVRAFQDTQNNLLDIIQPAKAPSSGSQTSPTEKLATLAGWDLEQLNYLHLALRLPAPVTVATVALLKKYFDMAGRLAVDMRHLWQLAHASISNTSEVQDSAHALWAGLQTKYHGQTDVITNVQNRLNEGLRDKLVALAMHRLNIDTPRGLYEHFLIDVEVSGVVQTSRIKEAISAVQLYIYRCLNHLEPVVPKGSSLPDLWRWMNSYREWQANREVFLYPEDYIQPELRKNKTDLFTKIENDLKQADLTDPDSVTGIFQEYMNGFAEVANLKIVGSAARDLMIDDIATKELCLVGITRQQPNRYYYRVATFVYQANSSQYTPADWGQWQKIDIQIQPVKYPNDVGSISPVFAFGKWHIFWVEQKKTGGTTEPQSGEHTSQYTITIQYSHLDFSKRWVAAQTLVSLAPETKPVATSESKPVYSIYFNSIQTLYIAYRKALYKLTESASSLTTQVLPYRSPVRFQSTNIIPQISTHDTFQAHYFSQIGTHVRDRHFPTPGELEIQAPTTAFATWFKVNASNNPLPFCGWEGSGTTVSVQVGKGLIINNIESSLPKIKEGEWNHFAWSEDKIYFNGSQFGIHPFYVGTNRGGLYTLQQDNTWKNQENKIPIEGPSRAINCLYQASHLYAGIGQYGLYALQDDGTWEKQSGFTPNMVNCLLSHPNGRLYAGTNEGPYFFKDGTWTQQRTGIPQNTSVLCLHYHYPRGRLYAGTLSRGLYALQNDGTWVLQNGSPLDGVVRCLYTHNNILYSGTNKGLYSQQGDERWQLVEGSDVPRDVFCLAEFRGELYAGTSNGLYRLYGGRRWGAVEGPFRTKTVTSMHAVLSVCFVGTDSGLYKQDRSSANPFAWEHEQEEGLSEAYIRSVIRGNIFSFPRPAGFVFRQDFMGSTQETLYFQQKPLSFQQIQELYNNSKDSITRDFDKISPAQNAFDTNIFSTTVLMQPNWEIIESNNAEYLSTSYQKSGWVAPLLKCYRLNSMAIYKLETLLHQPAGIDALLTVSAQQTLEPSFQELKHKRNLILEARPLSSQIDFTLNSAMSNYYWELFFHAPFLISRELNIHQRFKDAKKWIEYIFNPSISQKDWDLQSAESPNDKFWRFLGLRSANNPTLKTELSKSSVEELRSDLQNQAAQFEYETDPFDPHAIASLRPIAYQKTIVMHYIDNLLAWGDMLFRQNTRESIVEAEMFYVAAYDLLGDQPKNLGAESLPPSADLSQLGLQNQKPFQSEYFGIPRNRQFLAHWDKVNQRLYNIRHSLNISGERDVLPLFQPPINPLQLVAAVASGEGLQQALNGVLNPVIPHYRFAVMIEKAKAAAQTVIQLGQSLLSALEEKDAEELAALYNTNQQHILNLTRTSKTDQLKAAEQNIQALQASLTSAQYRQTHYAQLLSAGLSSSERKQLSLEAISIAIQAGAEPIQVAAIVGYLLPDIFGLADGGMQFGSAIQQGASVLESLGNILSARAGLASAVASYQRRAQDWQLQETIAQDDIKQIQFQILAAQYQQRLAEQESALLEKEIEQAQNVADFYLKKFTNQQLYQWYIGQLAALYSQAYELAHDIAVQAENAWKFEHIGRVDPNDSARFVKSGAWNSLHHGLLAGETLRHDLQRMEKAFTDQNERRLEIEKTISLAQLDPVALMNLKRDGSCVFDITEKDFDFDFPGHYARQLKHVSISLPVVLGPYQNIHATLTQLANKIVTSDNEANGQPAVQYLLSLNGNGTNPGAANPGAALRMDVRPSQQVAISQGVNDSGLFVLNFNDERYLPFEGTGAVSTWSLDIPHGDNSIDFDSLTDVIIQFQYTALVGSAAFKAYVQTARQAFHGHRIYSLAQTFSAAWRDFSRTGNTAPSLEFDINPAQWRRNMSPYRVTGLSIYAVGAGETLPNALTLKIPTQGQGPSTEVSLTLRNKGVWEVTEPDLTQNPLQLPYPPQTENEKTWTLSAASSINVENLMLIVQYSAGSTTGNAVP